MCNNEPGHACENCPSKQPSQAPSTQSAPIPVPRSAAANRPTSSSDGSARGSKTASLGGKSSSSPTDIEAEYLDIKCCGNKKLCGATDDNCNDEQHRHPHSRHDDHHAADASSTRHHLPPGTWEEKISSLAPHGHQVDVTLSADEAWKTLKAHPNAKFASLAMLADVVARGTKCLGQSPDEAAVEATHTPLLGATSSLGLDRPGPNSNPIHHGAGERDPMSQPPPPLPSQEHRGQHPHYPRVPIDSASMSPATADSRGGTPLPGGGGGKKRRFEVYPYAIKEALAVLDAHPGHPPLKKRRFSDLRGT